MSKIVPSHYTRAQVSRKVGLTVSQLKVVFREEPGMLVEIEGTLMVPSEKVKEIPKIRKRLGLPVRQEK